MTQTTTTPEQAARPRPFTFDDGPLGTRRARAWTGVVLGSLAVWASVIVGAAHLVNGG